MIICRVCGHESPEGTTFCGNCGAFLEWTGEQPAKPAPDPAAAVTDGTVGGPGDQPDKPAPVEGVETVGGSPSGRDGGAAPGLGAALTGTSAADPPGAPQITCRVCGTDNDRDRTFCRRCGNPLWTAEQIAISSSPPTPRSRSPGRVILAGGAIAVVAAFAIGFALLRNNPTAVPPTAAPSRAIATSSGVQSPSPSKGPPEPAGLIAFAGTPKGSKFDIYVIGADGSGLRNVASATTTQNDPSLSPDATMVAWHQDDGIWIKNFGTGAEAFNLVPTTKGERGYKAAWSCDVRSIAFAFGTEAKQDIYVRPAGRGKSTRVTKQPGLSFEPSWSPDGKQLAFTRGDERAGEIWTIVLATKAETRLTNNKVPDADPAWSPDGKQIAFSEQGPDGWQIWLMDANGKNPHRITLGGSDKAAVNHDPAWSPDGRFIAFAARPSGGGDLARDLYIYEVASGKISALGDTGGMHVQPSWRNADTGCQVPPG